MYQSTYSDGYYNGRAYFGTGGSNEDKLADFCVDDIHLRISNCGVNLPQKSCTPGNCEGLSLVKSGVEC
jgi:hypothetical protein